MWCWRKMLSISWQEHRTDDSILTELGLERELMGRVAKLKLQYFGHITQGSAGQLALTVLEEIMKGLRHQGRPRRQWIHDIEEWTGCEYIQLKEMSQDRAQWRRTISEWSSPVANPHRGRSTSEWVSEFYNYYILFCCVLRAWHKVRDDVEVRRHLCCHCTEFFEELLSLVDSLTSRQISARMWQILPHLYRLFFDDNTDLFVGESICTTTLLYCDALSYLMQYSDIPISK